MIIVSFYLFILLEAIKITKFKMKREYKVLFLFFLIFLSIFIVRMIDFVIIPTIFVPHISNEEIASARNGSQFMGEKRIQKEAEIDDLLERAEKGENLWDEI